MNTELFEYIWTEYSKWLDTESGLTGDSPNSYKTVKSLIYDFFLSRDNTSISFSEFMRGDYNATRNIFYNLLDSNELKDTENSRNKTSYIKKFREYCLQNLNKIRIINGKSSNENVLPDFFKKQHDLYKEFQNEFPLEALKTLPLERYTNLKTADSFCYWVESKTDILGSLWGGSSYKFGIYRMRGVPANNSKFRNDGQYSWYESYKKDTAEEAYELVRNTVVEIAENASKGNFEAIDNINELGQCYKWKIAFLYSNEQLVPVFKYEYLLACAKEYGFEGTKPLSSEMQRFLMHKKGDKDLFAFYKDLLSIIDRKKKEGSIEETDEDEINECRNYWWLVASPKIWSLSDLKDGEEQTYTIVNADGHPRRIAKNFADAQVGDLVIGYEATPVKQIVALAEITKASDGKEIAFKKTKTLKYPIDYDYVKSAPELHNMEFLKNMNGSLFKLTSDEYEFIMGLIEEESEINNKEIDSYSKEDFLNEVFVSNYEYDKLKSLILNKKNVILQGAPGVGKTFAAERMAYSLMGCKDAERVMMIQFHQNYSYEEFILGYKPNDLGSFSLKKGIFYQFCEKASRDKERDYFLIIDEINRGNLSKIFGEILMLIENTYRGKSLQMAYKDYEFSVPENLYIIGMMNTADRSLAMIDYALRRRFSFYEMRPAFNTEGFKKYQNSLNSEKFNKVISTIQTLNEEIANDDSLGDGFCIGHSYFCNQKSINDMWLENVIDFDILPMLKEYWFDDIERYKEQEKLIRAAIK